MRFRQHASFERGNRTVVLRDMMDATDSQINEDGRVILCSRRKFTERN